jgi:Cysteine-rich secretory protein family
MKKVTGLLAGLILAASVVTPWVAASPARADSWSDAMAFVGPINALRASHGLGQLAVDTRLMGLGNWWSGQMAGAGKLSHNGNLGAMLPSGWTLGGENVGYGGDAVSLENAFANSPEHLANMLKPEYTAIGVGVVWSGTTMWVTEDYMAGVTPIIATGPSVVAMSAMRGGTGSPGYWVTTNTGGVRGFGAAVNYGSMNGHLNAPIIGMSATADGRGYWLLAADGGIFTFGDALFYGSTGAMHLNARIVAMAATPTGHGYWMVAADGGIFTFGDAGYYGSTGGKHLNAPVVGISAGPGGRGYRLVASDGGIFTFGNAPFDGSMGGVRLNRPVIGMSTDPATGGYRMVASDGGVFSFNAGFYGSLGGTGLPAPITTMAATVDGNGYYLISANGTIYCFGDAPYLGK